MLRFLKKSSQHGSKWIDVSKDTTTAGITAATSMPVEPFAGLSGYLFSMHCMLFILERKQNSRFVSQK